MRNRNHNQSSQNQNRSSGSFGSQFNTNRGQMGRMNNQHFQTGDRDDSDFRDSGDFREAGGHQSHHDDQDFESNRGGTNWGSERSWRDEQSSSNQFGNQNRNPFGAGQGSGTCPGGSAERGQGRRRADFVARGAQADA